MKYTVSFTAWYLNEERICQLIKPIGWGNPRASAKHQLENWLQVNPIPTLGELIATNQPLKVGTLFTIYHDFYGRGLSKYARSGKSLPKDAIAELYNSLKYDENRQLHILYSPTNLTSASAWSRFPGGIASFAFVISNARHRPRSLPVHI